MKRSTSFLFGAVLATAAAISGTTTGCGQKKATAIVVAISSEAAVPTEIDSIDIQVDRDGSTYYYPVDIGPMRDAVLPGTITLQNDPTTDSTSPVAVRITAYGHDASSGMRKQHVVRSATVGFLDERTKLLKMPLRYSCYDFPSDCGPGSTCKGGECMPDSVDPRALPDYEDSLVFNAPGATDGACFDERTADNGCFTNAVTVTDLAAFVAAGCVIDLASPGGTTTGGGTNGGTGDAGPITTSDAGTSGGGGGTQPLCQSKPCKTVGDCSCNDGHSYLCVCTEPNGVVVDCATSGMTGTCEFTKSNVHPQGGPAPFGTSSGGTAGPSDGQLNVAVHWARSTQSGFTTLDLDPDEGWSFESSSTTRARLAPGLCRAASMGGITAVRYSTQCAPKTLARPICPAPTDVGTGGNPFGTAGAGGTSHGGTAGSTGTGGGTGSGGGPVTGADLPIAAGQYEDAQAQFGVSYQNGTQLTIQNLMTGDAMTLSSFAPAPSSAGLLAYTATLQQKGDWGTASWPTLHFPGPQSATAKLWIQGGGTSFQLDVSDPSAVAPGNLRMFGPAGGTGGGGSGGGTNSCHDVCSVGPAQQPVCSPCAGLVCSKMSSCCTQTWGDTCVAAAQSLCGSSACSGSGGGTGAGGAPAGCVHSECTTGAPLGFTCSTCAEQVCASSPSCCTNGWTSSCVQQAQATCGLGCGGSGTGGQCGSTGFPLSTAQCTNCLMTDAGPTLTNQCSATPGCGALVAAVFTNCMHASPSFAQCESSQLVGCGGGPAMSIAQSVLNAADPACEPVCMASSTTNPSCNTTGWPGTTGSFACSGTGGAPGCLSSQAGPAVVSACQTAPGCGYMVDQYFQLAVSCAPGDATCANQAMQKALAQCQNQSQSQQDAAQIMSSAGAACQTSCGP